MSTYRIIRHYRHGLQHSSGRTIYRRAVPGLSGLSLAEAQAHCQDPETSSSTATSAARQRYTDRVGPWFDGYTAER